MPIGAVSHRDKNVDVAGPRQPIAEGATRMAAMISNYGGHTQAHTITPGLKA